MSSLRKRKPSSRPRACRSTFDGRPAGFDPASMDGGTALTPGVPGLPPGASCFSTPLPQKAPGGFRSVRHGWRDGPHTRSPRVATRGFLLQHAASTKSPRRKPGDSGTYGLPAAQPARRRGLTNGSRRKYRLRYGPARTPDSRDRLGMLNRAGGRAPRRGRRRSSARSGHRTAAVRPGDSLRIRGRVDRKGTGAGRRHGRRTLSLHSTAGRCRPRHAPHRPIRGRCSAVPDWLQRFGAVHSRPPCRLTHRAAILVARPCLARPVPRADRDCVANRMAARASRAPFRHRFPHGQLHSDRRPDAVD